MAETLCSGDYIRDDSDFLSRVRLVLAEVSRACNFVVAFYYHLAEYALWRSDINKVCRCLSQFDSSHRGIVKSRSFYKIPVTIITRDMFSLSEISEQLKDVSQESVGVSFAGQSLVFNTASDGKLCKIFSMMYLPIRVPHVHKTLMGAQLSVIRS